MSRILFWLGDQFERGMAHDFDCDSACYRASEFLYRLGWRLAQ